MEFMDKSLALDLADKLDKNEKCMIALTDYNSNVKMANLTELIERTFLYTAIVVNVPKIEISSFAKQKYPYLVITNFVSSLYNMKVVILN